MTLRARLTAAFLAVVFVPLLVGVALLGSTLPRASADRQDQEVTSSARLAATVVAQWCERARAVAEAAGRVVTTPGATTDLAMRRAALESLLSRGLADGVGVMFTTGETVEAGRVPADPAECAEGDVTGPQVAASVRLATADGTRIGTAVAAVDADDEAAASLRNAAGRGQVALLTGQEVVAASGPVPAELVRRAIQAVGQPVHGDGRVAVLLPPRPGQALGVLVVQPEADAGSVLPTLLGVVAGAGVLAAGIALVLARATTRPLEELGDAAARIAGGDLSTTLEVRSADEVGRLAMAFNAMTVDLRRSIGALQASRDELQSGLTRLGETLSSTHDLDGIVTVVLETAMASTQAQAGAVLLVEPSADGSEVLRTVAGRGLEQRGATTGLRVPVGAGILGRVAQDGEPVGGPVDDRLPAASGEPHAEHVLAVPLRSSRGLVGVLALYDRAGGFDDADLRTIRSFAGQATVAIDNVLLHEEAQRLSLTDALTGLWNYRYFTLTASKEIERAARFDRPLALLMLDLDLFKDVNDRYGHQRGDAVLIELAERLREQVRDVDTVARYGGEEVVVLLPETDEQGAAQAAERLADAVRGRPFGGDHEPPVALTVSIGAAVFPLHAGTASALLARADQALYDAKRAGRNTWRLAGFPSSGTVPPGRVRPPEPVREQGPH